jgi:hypothetical protein
MAPIYTARHVSASDRTIPLFSLKGLTNYAPTTVSQCGIAGVPLERQVAYTQYTSNIAHFIKASATGKSVTITNRPLGVVKLSRTLPLLPPPVHFTLQKEISHDQAEKMIRLLGAGASKTISGKTTIFQAPSLDSATLSKVLPLASSHFNAGRDAVNPMGLRAFWFIAGVFAELLRVHSYAAFSAESKESIVELATLLRTHQGATYHEFTETDVPDARAAYSRYLYEDAITAAEEGMEVDDRPEVKAMKEHLRGAKGYVSMTGVDTVPVARPPRNPVVNVGSSAQVPESSGILFPYFHGLLQPDQQSLMRFVHSHAFLLLGNTVQECQDNYAQLRRGFNSLSTTEVGMALSHLGLGLELALQTQGRCFAICDSNRYQGFALLGARLAVFDSTKWVRSAESDILRDDLSVIDPHIASVKGLVTLFGELSSKEVYVGPAVSESTFSEPRNLPEVFEGIRFDQLGDQEKEMNRLVRGLNYMGGGYLARNPQVLCEVLETLFSDAVIELDRPTYISSVRAPLSARSYRLLSRFGPEAPSLWNERGQEYECKAREVPQTTGTKRKIGEMDMFANLPSRLLVTPKPLEIAVKDMERVIDKGCVRMDLKERAGRNRNMSIEAEKTRKEIWKVLVGGLHETGNKKRKVAETAKGDDKVGFDDALATLLG